MKIASWNVNSIKVRAPQVIEWLEIAQPDVLGVQELKLDTEQFMHDDFASIGYKALVNGQKTYNGVALLVREALFNAIDQSSIVDALPDFDDPQKRVLAVTINDTRIITVYVPNGQSVDSEKFVYKMAWLDALHAWLEQEISEHEKLLIMGDYNIAPEDRDVHAPEAWRGKVLFSEPEHAQLQKLLQLPLIDTFRLHHADAGHFSWWDYRSAGFRRNLGLRIDYLLTTKALSEQCVKSGIDVSPRGWERPSDHTPVWAQFKSTP